MKYTGSEAKSLSRIVPSPPLIEKLQRVQSNSDESIAGEEDSSSSPTVSDLLSYGRLIAAGLTLCIDALSDRTCKRALEKILQSLES